MNVIIIGSGKTGITVAMLLLDGNHHVKIIELRPEKITLLQKELPANVIVQGSGTDPLILEQAGIRQANVVVAVTGADQVNLIVASLARFEFNVPRIIARVNNPKNAWLFTREMGVDVAVNQSELMAHLIAEEMSLGDVMTLLKLNRGRYSLIEEKLSPKALATGHIVRDLNLPTGCILTAVIRKGQLLLPKDDLALELGDEVLAIVEKSKLREVAAIFG
jgi:trk system potassium uptake protein